MPDGDRITGPMIGGFRNEQTSASIAAYGSDLRWRASVQIERHELSDGLASVFDQDTCAIKLALRQKFADHASYPRTPA